MLLVLRHSFQEIRLYSVLVEAEEKKNAFSVEFLWGRVVQILMCLHFDLEFFYFTGIFFNRLFSRTAEEIIVIFSPYHLTQMSL